MSRYAIFQGPISCYGNHHRDNGSDRALLHADVYALFRAMCPWLQMGHQALMREERILIALILKFQLPPIQRISRLGFRVLLCI